MQEAGQRPNQEVESVVDNLGLRDMYVEYDWHENSPNPKVLKSARSWLIDQVKESPNDDWQELPANNYADLKGEQQLVFLQVMAHFKKIKESNGVDTPPLHINVDGTAGTGKFGLSLRL